MKIFTALFLLLIIPLITFGQEVKDLPYIQNDLFVSNAFGFPATVRNFQKKYGRNFTIRKEPVKNTHDRSVVDTVYTFSSGRTKIQVYKAKHRDILQSAFIDTDRIPLKYNIKVGESKTDIAKRLKASITADKVQVGDLEHGQVYTLTFSKGKLRAISYQGYVD